MSTQTASAHGFPTPCKRCGGALYRQVDYCPYCGAPNPLDTAPHKHTAMPGNYASAMSQSVQKAALEPATPAEADPTTRAAQIDEPASADAATRTRALVAQGMPSSPLAEPLVNSKGFSGLSVRVLYAIAAVVVIGLAYVGYALLGGRDSPNDSDDQASETTQDARTATGTIALYAPANSKNQSATGKPATPANSARPPQVIAMTPAAPAAPTAPSIDIAPVKPAAPQFRNATQAVQAARLALRTNDLSAAQAALGAAQALQPGNGDAEDLAAQLKPLTERRDAALQAAQTCVAQSAWPCARQHANDALAIDTGSDSAKSILERVIRETGWAPLTTHAAVPAK
jgi:hypothetical protein